MKRHWIVGPVVVALLASWLPAGTFGQEGEPPAPPEEGREGRRDRRDRGEERLLEEAVKQLGLEGEKAEAFKAAFTEGQQAAREAMQEAMKARDEKMREILGEEKFKEFQELARRAGRRGQGQGGAARSGGRPGEGPRGARPGEGSPLDRNPRDLVQILKRELDLDEAQVEKVAEIVSELQAEIQALAEKAREEGGDREAVREKARNMAREVMERLQPVLNPEQMAKLEEMRARLGRRLFQGDRSPEARSGADEGDLGEKRRRRLEEIRADLRVIPEVWAVLGEKIEEIIRVEQEHRAAAKERAGKMVDVVNSDASAEALLAEMKALREFRAAHEARIQALRKDLRELLDLKEEAKLILHGILD